MNVTMVSHSEDGGAGIAAGRLFAALQGFPGLATSMVVREKASWTPGIRSAKAVPHSLVDSIFLASKQWLRSRSNSISSHRVHPNLWDEGVACKAIEFTKPDIVNLHWLGKNFLSLHSIKKIGKPIVLTLHDAWYLTGGCFQPGQCSGYKETCGNCPLEGGNPSGQALISKSYGFKKRAFSGKTVVVVSPSRWMANLARSSSVARGFAVEIIPNGIDCSLYKPQNKVMARRLFGLPEDPFFLLFGSAGGTTDPNKGFQILQDALSLVGAHAPKNLHVIVFGAACDAPHFPVPIHFVGPVRDERAMSALYACADAVAVPSLHETFSLVTIESLACGRPVVAFGNSGPGEIIVDGECGWVAPEVSPIGFADALTRCFEDQDPALTSERARSRALENYRIENVAKKYADLFDRTLQQWRVAENRK